MQRRFLHDGHPEWYGVAGTIIITYLNISGEKKPLSWTKVSTEISYRCNYYISMFLEKSPVLGQQLAQKSVVALSEAQKTFQELAKKTKLRVCHHRVNGSVEWVGEISIQAN